MLYALPWLLPTLSDFSKKNAYTNREVQCIAVRWSMLQSVAFLGVPCLEQTAKSSSARGVYEYLLHHVYTHTHNSRGQLQLSGKVEGRQEECDGAYREETAVK